MRRDGEGSGGLTGAKQEQEESQVENKGRWWLEQDLYRLARYYARMYPYWLREYRTFGGDARDDHGLPKAERFKTSEPEREAIRRDGLRRKIEKIEKAATDSDKVLASWLLLGVRENLTFRQLKAQGLPCEKDMYYDRRKKMYYILAHSI